MENKQKSTGLQAVMIGCKLLLICAVIAGIVSLVYAVTLDQYEKNVPGTKTAAIGEIFGKSDVSVEALGSEGVYRVLDGERLLGYCVETASAGFGGDIVMMVGYDAEQKISGISIISMSESPGFGAKYKDDPALLEEYYGKSGALTLGKDVDGISGATVSSSAVLEGVNQASRLLSEALKGDNK